MIKHIVMIKVKDFDSAEKKSEVLQKLKKEIDNLKGVIEQIRFLETGLNVSESVNAYDLVLVSEFNSLEDLDIYRKHRAHVIVAEYLKEVQEKINVVDYNID